MVFVERRNYKSATTSIFLSFNIVKARTKARFIRRISVVSNAIQTIDNRQFPL